MFQKRKTKPQTNKIPKPKTVTKAERCARSNNGIDTECYSTLVPTVVYEIQLPQLNLLCHHSSMKKIRTISLLNCQIFYVKVLTHRDMSL